MGRECGCFGITYILRNCPEYGLADGYCIIGWQKLKENCNE